MLEAWLLSLWRIVEVVLGIGFVIFVHELGHFLVAKRVGIRVEVFSLGFGTRLFGWKRGDTDYRVSLVPLGGYVKMAGENPDEPATGAGDEFAAKSVGARAAVIVAGVCMNTVFAVLAFLFAFKWGVNMDAPAVGRVQPGTAAEVAGLRYGDRIVSINGAAPLEFMDVALAAAYASGPLDIAVERRGKLETIRVQPRRSPGSPVQQLGFGHMEEVAGVAAGSAAERAGLRQGDWILGVDGKPVGAFAEFIGAVQSSPGKPLAIDVKRGAEYRTVTLTPLPVPARTFGIALAPTPVVGKVEKNSAAAEAGLKPGDAFVEVSGAPGDIRTLREKIAAEKPGEPVKLVVLRAGERKAMAIVPRRDGPEGKPLIGIQFGASIVGAVAPGSPAAAAAIAPGDRFVEYLGRPAIFQELDAFDQLANSVEPEKELAFKIERAAAGARAESVKLSPAPVAGRMLGEAGVEVTEASFPMKAPGVIEPVKLGFDRTITFMEQVFLTFSGMSAGRIDPSTLGGPIGIATAAYHVAEYGFGKLIYFLAIISVNLAVLNILPIPILDGGHLVFLALEKVKGSPVAPGVQAAAQWVGLAILLGLMIFVTKNDIMRTFFGG